jgi:hypothetical protein
MTLSLLLKNHSRALINAADAGWRNGGQPLVWPKELSRSESYEHVLRRTLQTAVPAMPAGKKPSPDFLEASKRTERWRHEIIDMAADETRRKGERGIQRTESFNLLGKSLGAPVTQATVPAEDIERLINTSARSDPYCFLKWLAHTKHLADAQVASLPVDLPLFDPQVEPHLIMDFGGERSSRDHSKHQLNFEFDFPPIKTLLECKPTELFEIRKDYSHRYLADLKNRSADPMIKPRNRFVIHSPATRKR